VRRLRWKGPIHRISAIARQGTEPLCQALMKRIEEIAEEAAAEAE
jgi:GTPase